VARTLKYDKVLFTATLLLVFASIVMVYSASALVALERYQQPYLFVTRQVMWTVLGLALLALVMIAKLGLYIVIAVVVCQVVVSWVNPYTPIAPLLNSMTRPFLRPFQRLIPPIANVDLSPLVLIIICQLMLMLPIAYLELAISRLFR